ncbi:hypothetical protein CXX89_000852 [Escherichia coli]|jgi:hypothetical protein|uniref:Uncharacterized protein n=3 Tax=Citrobacter freundii complex TaxID=1344959 RepID=A0A7W3HBJ4_CITFR|nr:MULTISPECIES: hypothetical protein [Enterobacteriaceae]EDR9512915.1 hypothetical protein [Salmonella enterica subsp. enterica serovar Weltevreden]DAO58676.1 MAG TPA: hypothetical protein [Caudoviricetes sp.]EDU1567252.1 hypothetical protein [Salmonella enterica subsp. enterica serovar Weltevreden]EFB9975101.1 hypothetical protein [Escherichia coli]EFC0518692.1 hypothetical protein [Escherichia coli]
MSANINYTGVVVTSLNILASAIFSFFLTHSLTNNSDALNLVANVFSILSGFLLLVITMSGENSSILSNLSALDIANQEKRFAMRFNKYYALFLLYILTLALIFIYYLLSKEKTPVGDVKSIFIKGIGYCISFLTCFSFIQSTFIPLKIKELFKEKRELNK